MRTIRANRLKRLQTCDSQFLAPRNAIRKKRGSVREAWNDSRESGDSRESANRFARIRPSKLSSGFEGQMCNNYCAKWVYVVIFFPSVLSDKEESPLQGKNRFERIEVGIFCLLCRPFLRLFQSNLNVNRAFQGWNLIWIISHFLRHLKIKSRRSSVCSGCFRTLLPETGRSAPALIKPLRMAWWEFRPRPPKN